MPGGDHVPVPVHAYPCIPGWRQPCSSSAGRASRCQRCQNRAYHANLSCYRTDIPGFELTVDNFLPNNNNPVRTHEWAVRSCSTSANVAGVVLARDSIICENRAVFKGYLGMFCTGILGIFLPAMTCPRVHLEDC